MVSVAALGAFGCVVCLLVGLRAAVRARQKRVARLLGRAEPEAAVPVRERKKGDPARLRRNLVLGALGAAGGFCFAMALLGNLPLALGAMVAGVFVPRVYESRQQAAKSAAFARQLESAVLLMASVLRAGGALPQAVSAVADRVPDPLGSEFRYAAKRVHAGLSAQDALAEIAGRVSCPEYRMLVVACQVCGRTGGDLARILDRVGEAVRARRSVAQSFRAFTAEGRLSATVIGLMPVVVIGIMRLMMPYLLEPFMATSLGQVVFYGCFLWMGVGWLVISRIVSPPRGVEL